MGIFNFFRRKKKSKPNTTVDIKVETKTEAQPKAKPSFEVNINNDVNPIYRIALENGLLPGEIVLLDWLNGKSTDSSPPGYFKYTYGLNSAKSKDKLLNKGLLATASPKDSLGSLKVAELKSILKENELKVSGNKANLITRIQNSLTNEEIKKHIKNAPLALTEDGKVILDEYYYIVPAHRYGSKDSVYDVAAAIKFFKSFKGDYRPSNGDISWQLFQNNFNDNIINGNYGLARNSFLSMAEQLYREDKTEDSLNQYLKVFIMDMSGLGNGRQLEHPDLVFVAPGIMSKIDALIHKIELNDKDLMNLFNISWDQTSVSIPFHYLTIEECFDCLKQTLNNKDNIDVSEEFIKSIVTKKYKSLNEKDFVKKYNLEFPLDFGDY